MTDQNRLSPPVLVAAVVVLGVLAGCNPFRRGEKLAACHRPQLYAAAENLPVLQIPAGLDAPNTRAAMRIPDLNEPEAPVSAGDPCLEEPPKYSNAARLEPVLRDRKGNTPAAAPKAPAPAPAPAPAAPAGAAPAPQVPPAS